MLQGLQRFATWIVLAPVFLFLIAFALANRQNIGLYLNPLSAFDTSGGIEMPLFFALFAFFVFGAVTGSFVTWNSQRPWRNTVKRQAKEIEALRGEINVFKNGPVPEPVRPDWQILPPL